MSHWLKYGKLPEIKNDKKEGSKNETTNMSNNDRINETKTTEETKEVMSNVLCRYCKYVQEQADLIHEGSKHKILMILKKNKN